MNNNEFFEIYITYQHDHMASGTYLSRNSLLRKYFLPPYGEWSPNEITRLDITNIYDDMEEQGLSRNTILGAYSAFISYFNFAVLHGVSNNNPASRSLNRW